MDESQVIEADLTWIGDAFESGMQVEVCADGVIGRVGKLGLQPTSRLDRQALLPGMINAHSHAFQRGLRGRAETFQKNRGTFWSWRETMYQLVQELDADTFHDVCVQCFREMLQSGITAVGEFHYLHHDESCDGFAFDELVFSAAATVGIRIALLNACYLTGDISRPPEPAQRRFDGKSAETYLERLGLIQSRLASPTQSVGIVAHSIRAVTSDAIKQLHEYALEHGLPFHMHVEEQQREIDTCLLHYKTRPMEWLLDHLDVGPEFTAVHCTHTHLDDLQRLIAAKSNICICPLTEANLGDGIAPVPAMWDAKADVCLGTDSNVRIDMVEEMRWLEYCQRMKHEARGVCIGADGGVASGLFRAATVNGARSLGLQAGKIVGGALADFVTIDLDAPSLDGWTRESLLPSLVFGSDGRVIRRVCVGGRWIP